MKRGIDVTRNHIFDILEQEFVLADEVERLEDLLSEEIVFQDAIWGFTLEKFIDQFCLAEWKNRNTLTSFFDFRDMLEITEDDMRTLDDKKMFIYLEFIVNMLYLLERKIKSRSDFETTEIYFYITGNIKVILEKLNMYIHIIEEKEQVWILEKDPAVTSVAEIVDQKLALDIIEYNHYSLKGDIDKKRKILKSIADKFEAIRPELKEDFNDLQSDAGFLLNSLNIRHNNLEGSNAISYLQTISLTELEDWYDETYQVLLLALLEHDNIERRKRVKVLKQKMGR